MRHNRARDPHWITLRYDGQCTGCPKPLPSGSRVFYYPNSKSMYGQECGCGEYQQNQFDAAVADELNNGSL
jgi:hypothetical protein